MNPPEPIANIPNVCEIEWIGTPSASGRIPDLLLEVPHGATRRADFERIRALLSEELPSDLTDFFFVNTDVGATEYATEVARLCCDPATPRTALVIRCLIPRTFIDTNRVVDAGNGGGLTAAIADYVRSDADRAVLLSLHQRYHAVVDRAYDWICSSGGLAVMPHTYAPKSVSLPDEAFDEGIGKALRSAYSAEKYETWETRPEVDVISQDADGEMLAAPELVASLRREFATTGIEMAENASYRLLPASMAYRYAARHRQQVLCLEVRRDLVGDPFTPFDETPISKEKVRRIAVPIAKALLDAIARRAGTVGSGDGSAGR